MSIDAMTAAFKRAANGELWLRRISLHYDPNGRQMIRAIGSYRDGSLFEHLSAPFDGSPTLQAEKFAREIVQLQAAHGVMRRDSDLLSHLADKPLEGRPMPAPSSIRGLPGTLRDHLKRMTDRANKVGDNFGKSADNLHNRLDEVEAHQKEVDDVAREIQEVIGTPNGGPPLE